MSEHERLLASIVGDDEWSRHQTLERLGREGAGADLLDALGRALADEADAARRAGARMALAALASPGSPGRDDAQALLRRDLRSTEPDVRVLAASALGEAGDPEAVDALIRALADADPNVGAAAADALGVLGNVAAIAPLSVIAISGPVWVRIAAVVALGRLRDPRALPALQRAVRHRLEEIGTGHADGTDLDEPVIEAVRRIGDADGLSVLAMLRDRAPMESLLAAGSLLSAHPELDAPEWVREGATAHLPALRARLLEAEDPAAARLVGASGDPEAARELARLVGPPRTSEAAMTGLLAVPAELRADVILDRLAEAGTDERVALLALLPPLRSEERIARLVPLLEDRSPTVRAAAAESLARAPADQALPLLTVELSRTGTSPEVVRALGGLGGVACGALVPLLDDEQAEVRRAAAEALARCGSPQVTSELRTALDRESETEARGALLRALARAAGADAVDRLVLALDEAEVQLRLSAIEALGMTGAASAVAPLGRALDAEPPESLAALRALGDIGDPAAAPMLEPRLASQDLETRRVAAQAAVRMAAALPDEAVTRLTRDPDEWVRICAARILARRGEGGRGALRWLADEDPAPSVRQEARAALGTDR